MMMANDDVMYQTNEKYKTKRKKNKFIHVHTHFKNHTFEKILKCAPTQPSESEIRLT